jgi:hypothetical protein
MEVPMKLESILALAVVALTAVGCATQRPPEKEIMPTGIPAGVVDCSSSVVNDKACVVRLNVTPKFPDSCEINFVDPDADLVTFAKPPPGSSPLIIYWVITTPGYIFTRDGIAFVDNFRPRSFDDGFRQDAADRNIFQWTNLHPKRRVNGYVISVRNAGNPITNACEKDPWIRAR